MVTNVVYGKSNIKYNFSSLLRKKIRTNKRNYNFEGCLYKRSVGIRDIDGSAVMVNCGKCLYCLTKKQSMLEFFAKKELFEAYRAGKGASFVTLTYSDDYVPMAVEKKLVRHEKYYPLWNLKRINGKKTINENYVMVRPKDIKNTSTLEKVMTEGINTLYKKDFKDFMKRFRRNMDYYKYKGSFKYIYCGEYGDKIGRSHMHMVLIGLTKEETEIFTKKTWRYGIIDIGPLGRGGIRYLIDYVTKSQQTKEMKQLLDEKGVEPPFIYHSIRMGIDWIIKNAEQCYENNFYYYSGATAKKTLMPTRAIKIICNILNKNFKNEMEKIINNYEAEIKGKATAQGKEPGLMLWEERVLKEELMYNSIRTEGKRPISPEYLTKIKSESIYAKPKSKRVKPWKENVNMWKLAEKAAKNKEEDKETRKKYNEWIAVKEWINYTKAMNFFENCAKKA